MLAPCLGKYGGIETFSLTLCEDLLKKGASLTLLRKKVPGFNSDGSIEKNEREIFTRWTSNEKNNFFSQYVMPRDKRIRKAVKDCDIVHLHNPMAEGVWWAKRERKPCVMTIYNWRRRGISPRLLIWKWAVANVDRRWYISKFVWNTWEKEQRKGSDRLPVVSQMPTGEFPLLERKGFLFIGRFIPNKGIRILLDAYKRLDADTALWPLVLVGDGPLREEIKAFITSKNIQGVHLTGFVSQETRHRLTREAKWMVTPPHTNEDLGLTPLEARSVGVPCIATMDGGVPETAGRHALFAKPGCAVSLAKCLQEAVDMNVFEYEQKALLAKKEIEEYVRPLDEYAENYLQLLERN